MNAAQLLAIMPRADPGRWVVPINSALAEYSIDGNAARVAMFLAQVAEETGGLTRLEENMNYSAERLLAVWPSRFTPALATLYAHDPSALADFVYANRMGNGDQQSGDGWLFHGRGPPMLTGRKNYTAAGFSLGIDNLTLYPDQVATDATVGMRTAAWFWAQIGGNALADAGDFDRLSARWNGADPAIGLVHRVAYWQTAQEALA
ncbi:MAG TPA: glycoside hydrolase family 19 protein [Casimicrobiaceae bacterium]|nr:glycoside hydrolase family 19 protein [Casimicrobiaceae bacterium]